MPGMHERGDSTVDGEPVLHAADRHSEPEHETPVLSTLLCCSCNVSMHRSHQEQHLPPQWKWQLQTLLERDDATACGSKPHIRVQLVGELSRRPREHASEETDARQRIAQEHLFACSRQLKSACGTDIEVTEAQMPRVTDLLGSRSLSSDEQSGCDLPASSKLSLGQPDLQQSVRKAHLAVGAH